MHERAGLLPAPVPRWMHRLLACLEADTGLYSEATPLNHVLVRVLRGVAACDTRVLTQQQVNAYEPGEGILPHQDGPLYHPAVCIVSLGAGAVMQFTPHASLLDAAAAAGAAPPPGARVWLPRRSLLMFSDEAYTGHLHGIAAQAADDLRSDAESAQGVCNPPAGMVDAAAVPRGATRVSLTCRSVLKVRRNLLPVRP